MSRKPDLPCAACGKLMWGSQTNLPAGQAMCRPCRAATYLDRHAPGSRAYKAGCRCDGCKSWKTKANAKARGRTYDPNRPCEICSVSFTAARHTQKTCSPACAVEIKRRSRQKMRAVRRAAFVEHVDRLAIHERDRWRCYMCRKPMSRTARVPHPRAATLDHLVPYDRGGKHEAANVASACFGCNSRKGNRGGNEQLLLIG